MVSGPQSRAWCGCTPAVARRTPGWDSASAKAFSLSSTVVAVTIMVLTPACLARAMTSSASSRNAACVRFAPMSTKSNPPLTSSLPPCQGGRKTWSVPGRSLQLFQAVKELERLARRKLVGIELRQLVAQRVRGGFRLLGLAADKQVSLLRRRQARVLQNLEIAPRLPDHRLRHACEPGDLQAVALACRSFLYRVQEHHAVLVLYRVEMDVGHLLVVEGKARHLEVVSGEQAQGAVLFHQMPRNGPGEREAVEGRGPPSDLVHQHQAFLGGVRI